MKVKLMIASIAILLVSMAFGYQYIFQKISMDMEMRSVTAGKSARIKANIYYTAEGKMVSYYTEPQEMVIVNNKKGEILIYNPGNNTVIQQQNYTIGTETTQLYYFLENKRNDLGLSAMGYSVRNTRFEDGLKITEWNPPMSIVKEVSKVELVHEKGNPIFMAYHSGSGGILKKIFFYNYTSVSDYITMPTMVTQIEFKTSTDSVITKTTYSQFRLNQNVTDDKLNFVAPPTAKVISK